MVKRGFVSALPIMMALGGCVVPKDTWVRTVSPHFELIGAMPGDDAEDFVRTLETFRTALLAIVFDGRLKHPGRMVVIVADRLSRYSRTAELGGTAMNAAIPALGMSEVMILDGTIFPRTQLERVAKHELTHAITLPYAPGMPHWYSEGIAGLFETIDIDRARGVVSLDRWDRSHERYRYRPLSVEAVFAWQAPIWDVTAKMQYATAIQLLQMLQQRHPRMLSAFEAAMHEGSDWTQAWSETFGDDAIARLTTELQAFTFTEPPTAGRVSLRFSKPEVGVARMASNAEIHAARALLYGYALGRRKEAQAVALATSELEASLSEDDAGATGLLAAGLLYDGYPEARAPDLELARIRRVLARDPTSWRAAVLLSQTEAPLRERTQALERTWPQHRDEPYLVAALARVKLEHGDARGALDLVKATPGKSLDDPYIMALYLDALAANHSCDRQAAARARQAADTVAWRKRISEYADRQCPAR